VDQALPHPFGRAEAVAANPPATEKRLQPEDREPGERNAQGAEPRPRAEPDAVEQAKADQRLCDEVGQRHAAHRRQLAQPSAPRGLLEQQHEARHAEKAQCQRRDVAEHARKDEARAAVQPGSDAVVAVLQHQQRARDHADAEARAQQSGPEAPARHRLLQHRHAQFAGPRAAGLHCEEGAEEQREEGDRPRVEQRHPEQCEAAQRVEQFKAPRDLVGPGRGPGDGRGSRSRRGGVRLARGAARC